MSTLSIKELSHPAGEVIKIAAGKTLDLNSQGDVVMPTGSVLQVQTYELLGTTTTISTTSEVTLPQFNATFTKKHSDSKLVCYLQWYSYYSANNATWWSLRAFNNGTAVTSGTGFDSSATVASHNQDQYLWQAGAHQQWNTHFWDDQNTITANITFSIRQNVAGSLEIWGSGGPRLIIMEIAQ